MRRIVSAPCAGTSRCASRGSSSSSLPSARSCMTATAVNVFVIDPTRYWWSAVASSPLSASASPTASSQTSSRFRTTAAATLGSRFSAWSSAITRRNAAASASGAGKDSERARDRVDRAVDRVVVDVEVRDRAKLRRPDRRRQENALLAHSCHRLLHGEAERADVDLDEIRLDLREVDRDAGLRERLAQTACARVV